MQKAARLLPILLLIAVVIAVWASLPPGFFEQSPVTENPDATAKNEDPATAEGSDAAREPITDSASHSALGASADRIEYRVVDRETSEPIAGVRALATWARRDLGTSDSKGRISIAAVDGKPTDPTRVAFAAEGYLLAIFTMGGHDLTRMNQELEAGEPVEVRLFQDTHSFAIDLHFSLPTGRQASAVRYRVDLLEALSGTRPKARRDAEYVMARRSHQVAGFWARLGALPFHIGFESNTVIHSCEGSQVFRVEKPGRYRCTATAAGKWIGSTDFVVDANGQRVDLSLQQGNTLSGQVQDENGKAIAAVAIDVTGGDLGDLRVLSSEDGRFEAGPFSVGELVLQVEHPEFEPMRPLAVSVPAAPILVSLQTAARVEWAGQIRERGTGLPITSARVRAGSSEATTDHEGRFRIDVSRQVTQLEIVATGYLRYVERGPAGSLPTTFELIPDQRAARVKAGLTAVIHGVLSDDLGEPVADAPIELRVQGLPGLSPSSQRTIDMGGEFPFGTTAISDAKGRFELETSSVGPSRVFCQSGIVDAVRKGRSLTLTRGERYQVDLQFVR